MKITAINNAGIFGFTDNYILYIYGDIQTKDITDPFALYLEYFENDFNIKLLIDGKVVYARPQKVLDMLCLAFVRTAHGFQLEIIRLKTFHMSYF